MFILIFGYSSLDLLSVLYSFVWMCRCFSFLNFLRLFSLSLFHIFIRRCFLSVCWFFSRISGSSFLSFTYLNSIYVYKCSTDCILNTHFFSDFDLNTSQFQHQNERKYVLESSNLIFLLSFYCLPLRNPAHKLSVYVLR